MKQIDIRCPHCNQKLGMDSKVFAGGLGKKTKCPKCNEYFVLNENLFADQEAPRYQQKTATSQQGYSSKVLDPEPPLLTIFDFKFDEFVYPRLLKLIYKIFTWVWGITFLIVSGVIAINCLLMLFKGYFFYLLLTPILLILWALLWLFIQAATRCACEVILVIFRIHQTLKLGLER